METWMMEIRLRVAGIYFNRFLNVPANADGSPITIKNAMDFCKATYDIGKENGFDYGPKAVNMPDGRQLNLVDCISHFFSGAYDFNGDGKITPGKDNKGKTLGNNTRAAGLYALKEQTIQSSPQISLVWQYYVRELNGEGSLRSRTMPSNSGFTSFDKFELKDGDELLWRLVTIQFGPMIPAEKMTPKLAFNALRYL
jgi:hypothetical protein